MLIFFCYWFQDGPWLQRYVSSWRCPPGQHLKCFLLDIPGRNIWWEGRIRTKYFDVVPWIPDLQSLSYVYTHTHICRFSGTERIIEMRLHAWDIWSAPDECQHPLCRQLSIGRNGCCSQLLGWSSFVVVSSCSHILHAKILFLLSVFRDQLTHLEWELPIWVECQG